VPDNYPLKAAGYRVDQKGIKYIRVKGVRWFTNLDVPIRHETLTLYKRYNPEEYPRYINYDAIEVSKTAEIPYDYEGEMGVPITFLDKYNPEQFEIVGSSRWLGKPMSDFAPKGTYVQGGIRFYLLDKQDDSTDNPIEQSRAEQSRAEQSISVPLRQNRHQTQDINDSTIESLSNVKFRRLYDRVVIRRKGAAL
jgi:hypothetical protein